MRRSLAGLLVLLVALVLGGAAPALAQQARGRADGRVRFLPTGQRPSLAKVNKRGKLAVSRDGSKLRIKAYVPTTRDGVAGVEIRELERDAAPGSSPRDQIKAAMESFDAAAEIAVDQTWRKDLGPADFYKGVLDRVAEGQGTDEVGAFDHAIDGLARSLRADEGPTRDKWTQYQDPVMEEAAKKRIAGATIGMGMTIKNGKRGLVIRSTIPKSAAARAGLRKGDALLSIDGEPVTAETWQAKLASKGEQPFRLEYERAGVRKTVEVTRAPMRWPLMARRTKEGVAVLRFNDGFTRGIAQEVNDALVGMDSKAPLRGIVLDLRGNGGGLVAEAHGLLDQLIGEGTLGLYAFGDGKRQRIIASGNARFPKTPVAVLIDGGSASMGEHVPNALQALAGQRPVVILGEPTYGKGLMQSTYPLPRGSFKISNAIFANGDGRTTQGNPVQPDISKAEAIRRQAAKRPGGKVVDPVLREAIDELDRMAKAAAAAPAQAAPAATAP